MARQPADQSVSEARDVSLENERKEEQFRDVEADWRLLIQVREALKRIENGTYGDASLTVSQSMKNGLKLHLRAPTV